MRKLQNKTTHTARSEWVRNCNVNVDGEQPATEWSDGSMLCRYQRYFNLLSYALEHFSAVILRLRRYGVPWIAFAILLLWHGNNSKKICASPKKEAAASVRWKELLPSLESSCNFIHIASDLMRYDTLMSLFHIRQNEFPTRLMLWMDERGKEESWMEQLRCYQKNPHFAIISSLRDAEKHQNSHCQEWIFYPFGFSGKWGWLWVLGVVHNRRLHWKALNFAWT